MKRLIILTTVSVIFTFLFASCTSVTLPHGKTEKEYIRQHAVAVPLGGKTLFDAAEAAAQEEIAEALDSVYAPYAGTKRVIFFGESHACAGNFVILDRFFPYFLQNFDVSTYVSEKGAAEGFLVDRYLRTGDEEILAGIMQTVSSSAAYTEDQAESFRRMRQLWIELPEEQRFSYIGIDIGHGLAAPVAAFYYIIEDIGGPPPEVLKSIPGMYREYRENGFPIWNDPEEEKIRGRITDIKSELSGEGGLTNYLGEYAAIARLIIDSAAAAYQFYDIERSQGYHAAAPLREDAIMDHFTRHHRLSPLPGGEVYFGQWGGFHIHQQYLGESKTIAGMINAPDGPFPGKVLSTIIFYNNCEYLDRKTGMAKPLQDKSGAFLGNFIDADCVLIPFEKSGSPFRDGLYFISGDESLPGVTTDYIQAGLLLQNSPAAGPYQ